MEKYFVVNLCENKDKVPFVSLNSVGIVLMTRTIPALTFLNLQWYGRDSIASNVKTYSLVTPMTSKKCKSAQFF